MSNLHPKLTQYGRREMMKAIVRRRWGRARDVVELADVPKPEPAVDEVLVHVRASSVNRSDYYVLGGAAILMRPMIGGFLRPKDERLGGDFAGIAEAVGRTSPTFSRATRCSARAPVHSPSTSRQRWPSHASRRTCRSKRRPPSPLPR